MTNTININVTGGVTNGGGYEFTNDWFPRHIPVWTQVVGTLNPARALEIGSYEGRSGIWLVENCKNPLGFELHCIDPWADYVDLPGLKMAAVEARFDKNMALALKANPAAKMTKHKKPATMAMAELITQNKSGYFDLIYIDGSHRAPDVLNDAVMAFHLLRVGGVMIFDDYLWHLEPAGAQNPLNMPKPAVDAFLNLFQQKMQVMVGAPLNQIYARKNAN
jgi:predicted O-methyltransferase YrrM